MATTMLSNIQSRIAHCTHMGHLARGPWGLFDSSSDGNAICRNVTGKGPLSRLFLLRFL